MGYMGCMPMRNRRRTSTKWHNQGSKTRVPCRPSSSGTVADKQIGHDGDHVSINVDDILDEVLDEVPDELYLPTIPKVPEHLRNVDVKAYEPEMIAIGPFTYELRSQNHLKRMEEHKRRYLKKLLERRGK